MNILVAVVLENYDTLNYRLEQTVELVFLERQISPQSLAKYRLEVACQVLEIQQ